MIRGRSQSLLALAFIGETRLSWVQIPVTAHDRLVMSLVNIVGITDSVLARV